MRREECIAYCKMEKMDICFKNDLATDIGKHDGKYKSYSSQCLRIPLLDLRTS